MTTRHRRAARCRQDARSRALADGTTDRPADGRGLVPTGCSTPTRRPASRSSSRSAETDEAIQHCPNTAATRARTSSFMSRHHRGGGRQAEWGVSQAWFHSARDPSGRVRNPSALTSAEIPTTGAQSALAHLGALGRCQPTCPARTGQPPPRQAGAVHPAEAGRMVVGQSSASPHWRCTRRGTDGVSV